LAVSRIDYLFTVLDVWRLRIFSWELHVQGVILCGLAAAAAYQNTLYAENYNLYHKCVPAQPENPEMFVADCYLNANSFFATFITDAEGQTGTLVRFILGMYASSAIANTYYKNRGLLGTTFARVLGFAMMVSTYVRPHIGKEDDQAEEVERVQVSDSDYTH
jgi:hypothetical protein